MTSREYVQGNERDTDTRQLMRQLCNDVAEIKQHVVGSPSNTGLVVRVDRLEQSEQIRKKYVFAAAGTGISAMAVGLWNALSKWHP